MKHLIKFNITSMIKKLKKLDIAGIYHNMVKATHNKPTSNIILNEEKVKAFLLRSEARKVCPFASLSLNIVLDV